MSKPLINLKKKVQIKRKVPQGNGLDDFEFKPKPPASPNGAIYAPVPPLSLNKYDIVPDTTYNMKGESKMEPYSFTDRLKMAGYSLGLGTLEDIGFEYSMKKQAPGVGQLYSAFDFGRDLKNAYDVFTIKPQDRYAKVDAYGNRIKDGDWKNEWKRQSGPIPGTIDWDGKEPEITDEWHKKYANGGMIKDNQMRKIKRYANGGFSMNNILEQGLGKQGDYSGGIGAGLNVVTGMFGQSNATSLKQAQQQGWMDAGKGLANGAQAGMMFGGPVGAIIGGVVGLGAGAIGHDGGIDQTEGFTQDNNYRYTTGIKRLFGGKNEVRDFREDQEDVRMNKFAVARTAGLQNDWANSREYQDAQYMYARGGMTGGSLAYVDDGEVIQQQNGQTQIVPERGHKTDSNLGYFPAGSMILSDTLKFPGTKKTFADISKEKMAKISKGTDRFAEGTNALNMIYNADTNRKLFLLQEAFKKRQGMKSDYTKIPKAKKGLLTEGTWTPDGWQDAGKANTVDADGSYFDNRTGVWMFPNSGAATRGTGTLGSDFSNGPAPQTFGAPSTTGPSTLPSYSGGNWNKRATSGSFMTEPGYGEGPTGSGSNDKLFGSIIGGATKLATMLPALSNLNEKAETTSPQYNPYEDMIKNNMRRRKLNINPILQGINNVAMTGNYNANQQNTSTGANMAFRVATNLQQQQATTNALAQKQNADNQYSAEYSNMLNNLGQQRVQANNLSTDINSRNSAAAANARRAGLSQISQFAQTQLLEKNQKDRDKMMMKLYGPFLSRGFDSETMADLKKYFG